MGPVRAVALSALVALVALAGCLAGTDAPRVPEIPRQGTWTLEGQTVQGAVSGTVEVDVREALLADGRTKPSPVVDVSVTVEGEGPGSVRYLLGDEGTRGVRSSWNVTVGGPAGSARYATDRVLFEPNPLGPFVASWVPIATSLQGHALDVGALAPASLTSSPGERVQADLQVADLDGGCANVTVDLVQAPPGRARFCGSLVPETVHWATDPPTRLRFERQAGPGETLAPAPDVQPRKPKPVEPVPSEGSQLVLTLPEAVDALRQDPRSGPWIEEHPDALASQGRYTTQACSSLGTPCSSIRTSETADQAVAWTLNWTAPNGDRMDARVVRPSGPGTSAQVTEVETRQGATQGTLDARAVGLGEVLEVWEASHDERFQLVEITYDLQPREGDPVWEIHALVGPASNEGVTASAFFRASTVFETQTGLIRDGWVTPR